jgi:uncharacterized membrane protein
MDKSGKATSSGVGPEKDRARKKRPRLDVPKKPTDKAIELTGYVALLLLFGLPAIFYFSLPESIPIHFGIDGVSDGYGPRGMIWLLPGIGFLLYAGMMWLTNYPHLFNYPVRLTTDNIFRQYRYAQRLLRIISALVVMMFAYLKYMSIQVSFGQLDAIPMWPVMFFLAAIFVSIGVYIHKALRDG